MQVQQEEPGERVSLPSSELKGFEELLGRKNKAKPKTLSSPWLRQPQVSWYLWKYEYVQEADSITLIFLEEE